MQNGATGFVRFPAILLPIVLVSLRTVLVPYLPDDSLPREVVQFAGDPVVSLLISVLAAIFTV